MRFEAEDLVFLAVPTYAGRVPNKLSLIHIWKRDGEHGFRAWQKLLRPMAFRSVFPPVYSPSAIHIDTELPTPVSYTHLDVYKRQP